MCPHCGYNLAADEPLRLGEWLLTPSTCAFGTTDLGLTPQEAHILYTIAKGGGDWVKAKAIINRVSDSDETAIVSMALARARKKLEGRDPVQSRPGPYGGYRWVG